MNNSARLFLALVPGNAVKADLALHRDTWRWAQNTALYEPADWHITLHFIGSVSRNRLDPLRAGLQVPLTPFDLRFGQPELWSGGVAVLCPSAVPDALQQLHAHLAQALQYLGEKTDSRPYRPHVTMARRARNALLPQQEPGFSWPVEGYSLMESTGQSTQRYRVLQHYGPGLAAKAAKYAPSISSLNDSHAPACPPIPNPPAHS